MITAYQRCDDRLQAIPLADRADLPDGVVWIDVLRPDEALRLRMSALLGIDLPTREDMNEIEASSRMYVEEAAIVLTTPVIARGDTGQTDVGLLTFVLTPTVLVTVRFSDALWFATFAARAMRHPGLVVGPIEAMLGLLEAVVDRAADVLEMIGGRLDGISARVFAEARQEEAARVRARPPVKEDQQIAGALTKPKSHDLRAAITGVGWAGDLTHKVRDCLVGLERLCAFLSASSSARMSREHKTRLKTITRDVHGLVDHAGFQAQQTNFLLDATLGVIDLQQTNIIKIFSVAAVAFLPPTLVASIYGMNFEFMPELHEPWGYPMAIGLMVLAAVMPLLYFRRRGWL